MEVHQEEITQNIPILKKAKSENAKL